MQGEQNLTIQQQTHTQNQQQVHEPSFNFSECSRIKKLTTHDIYRFRHQNMALILKLFAPQAIQNYEQEVGYLTRMNHRQVLKILYKRGSINPFQCEPLERSHLIVLKEAVRGDLNDYLPRFGKMTEKAARTLFLQLIQGLDKASKSKPAIFHPNLQATSILLDQNGQLQICGWSQLTTKAEQTLLQQSVFSCGEILICLMTSFMPFYKKYSLTDEFYKFITPEHIHKFWEQLLKSMNRVDKNFKFQPLFKMLVEKIFLKKITTFEHILNEQWVKGQVYSSQELVAVLQQNQKIKKQRAEAKKKTELDNQQKRRKALRDFELSYSLHRSSQTEQYNIFIKECQLNSIKEEEMPSGKSNIKIESPGFVIASLMEFLRGQHGKASIMNVQQFVLNSHKISKANSYAIIELFFSVCLLEDEEEEELSPKVPADSVVLKLKLSFMKDQAFNFVEIQAVESHFNSYYTNVAIGFLKEKIELKKEAFINHFKGN